MSDKTSMVRINADDKAYLTEFAHRSNQSIPDALHRLVREHQRLVFLQGLAEDFASNPISEQESKDQVAWEGIVSDGLDPEKWD